MESHRQPLHWGLYLAPHCRCTLLHSSQETEAAGVLQGFVKGFYKASIGVQGLLGS